MDPVAQQLPQPLYDGQTKAETETPRPRRVVDLMILLEDCQKFRFGNADARVPYLDAQTTLAPTATEQNLARLVYFIALESRLRSICSSRRGSLRITRLYATTRKTRRLA
jgi:hypothetical protein